MQHSPPPLFKQGASARVKVVFFAVFAIALLIVDSRINSLVRVRQVVATALYPLQMLVLMPRDAMNQIGSYFASTTVLQKELTALKQQQILQTQSLQKSIMLANENAHLRGLLDLQQRTPGKSLTADILYDARDEYVRKIVLSKGFQHGVALGQPVIDERGVIGQVTRVFPLTSEVTLLTDKNQAIPVQVERSGMRSVITGRGRSAYLDMRVTSNADIKLGDVLVTSGLDGIYPAGLQVAKVAQVESKASTTFEVVLCTPLAGIEQHKQLLILLVETTQLPPPESEEERTKKEKINRRMTRDSVKELDRDAVNAPPVNASDANVASQPNLSTSPAPAAPATPPKSEMTGADTGLLKDNRNKADPIKEDKK
ncbi:rod shape-determining protein MreC [Undibacterium seohonense]|uniref:Cell shape-determining protein MreC n=1 Tax=Undibacterium seohonense TaxID=1344950 RepID=A0ABR6X043_9BURK|nr:rod shape-determining protein MreC [Undibacterium seohonense]MBC3806274.1 rod shape-determining protein MreC [Undibacterium seohonense]